MASYSKAPAPSIQIFPDLEIPCESVTTQVGMKALEAKIAQEGIILTESQLAALEKAKTEKEAHGAFESECPGIAAPRTPSTSAT
jgi:hypothetical protein